ncbi:MAG: DNA polymerase III [Spirochaetaceae bacterium]|jgi:DNA polymerase-3 subunit gamma/tau|nr:DNA polymerase III [Spirochaetaceae bacterium]
MFEAIIGQNALTQLAADRAGGILAPSMLFSGPPASGKGTAGLELGRTLSCETPGSPPDCACGACVRHRFLTHPDLLSLGPRNFSSEMSAAAAAFQRKPESDDARLLFIRSVRKLLSRFSPVLWEEEPKFSKLSDMMLSLEEALDEIFSSKRPAAPETLKKQCDGILKTALKLEADGMSDTIPIGQIRRAAAWSHLAPTGGRKLLLIENADRMQDGARNSLLKILEEPPEPLTILLTTAREKALLPTILSRVRPYRFVQRPRETETEVIRRIFGDGQTAASGIGAYLDSFLPIPEERLRALAGFFAAYLSAGIAAALRKRGTPLPEELAALGERAAGIAEAAGLGKPGNDAQGVIAKIVAGAEKFEIRGLFSQFLSLLLALVSESGRSLGRVVCGGYYDVWRKSVGEAAGAVGIYNQSPVLALERLGVELKRNLIIHFR